MTSANRPSREKIADAARLEFAENGYAGARVARIAERAAVNKQLIFYYFGSKRGLYDAVSAAAARAVADAPTASDAARPATDQLRAAVHHLFVTLAERPELVSHLFEQARDKSLPVASGRQTVERLVRGIRSIVSEGQGLGYFRDDGDPDLAGQQALALCAAYLGLEPLMVSDPTPAARERWVGAVAEVLLRGLAW